METRGSRSETRKAHSSQDRAGSSADASLSARIGPSGAAESLASRLHYAGAHMPRNLLPYALLLATGLGGCAVTATTYTELNAPPRPMQAHAADQVEIFSSAPPERPHVDVGLITVQEGEGNETPASMVDLVRRAAAEKGCDAVVLAPPSSKTDQNEILGVESHKVYSGTCLVYGVAAPKSTPAPPPTKQRRVCRDRVDFEDHRNCVLPW